MSDNLVGKNLGHYRVTGKIGQGGMAFVYKAHDERLERDVAVKLIRRGAFPEEQQKKILQRFKREAISMARLSHPNIVKVLDSGEYEEAPYIVMEHMPGGTLKDRIGRPIPWQQAFQTLIPLTRCLSYAHQLGIIHRDVKPANILFSTGDDPVLSDFGIAKLLETEPGETLTESGVGIGTPEYMAPEQGKGEKVDARADIYSLGIVLYEMVTGRKPFIADTPMKTVIKHVTEPLPPPRNFIPDLPSHVENIMVKSLAKDPSSRYANMKEFASVMERALANKGALMEGEEETIQEAPGPNSQSTIDMSTAGSQQQYAPLTGTVIQRKSSWVIGAVVGGMCLIGIVALFIIGSILTNEPEPTTSPPPSTVVDISDSPTARPPQPVTLPDQSTYTPYPTYTPFPINAASTQTRQADLTCSTVNWKPRVDVGDTVRICTIYRLVLRNKPDGNEIIALFWDVYVKILDGPKCGQDAWWWKIEVPERSKYSPSSTSDYSNYGYTDRVFTGWVREGLDKELLPASNGYYLCP